MVADISETDESLLEEFSEENENSFEPMDASQEEEHVLNEAGHSESVKPQLVLKKRVQANGD